ncbi:MAG: thiamine pyrophosphate-dependent dehydrogenase E1 component subunit alpha [Kiritimatiellae bacterium]|nr:thiamine pyrophosphate-dependent dehydrogenase E1 component subunit alpha [Kiritimatiellia bacterium]
MRFSRKVQRRLYFNMLRIRQVELRIDALYLNDEMKTPAHLCIGQEAVAVGVCANLRAEDCISSNHRGHGHYLAKGGDLNALIAELHCKETGCSKGRGGSMHLVDTSVGHLGSSSIVGGGIPIATGVALAMQMRHQPLVSVAFFGDGAADEGVLYESVNFAMLKKLPVVYVLENNQYSVCSPVSARQVGDNLFHNLKPPLLLTRKVDGNDVEAVYEAARAAVERARSGHGPSFIECVTYRMPGHVGCAAQDVQGYRTEQEIELWRTKCPVAGFENGLIKRGILTAEDVAQIKEAIEKEIDTAFAEARNAPLPRTEELSRYLYKD